MVGERGNAITEIMENFVSEAARPRASRPSALACPTKNEFSPYLCYRISAEPTLLAHLPHRPHYRSDPKAPLPLENDTAGSTAFLVHP